jgi:peptide/nickel transport system ATP-binding protein
MMAVEAEARRKGDTLLSIIGLQVEGRSGRVWQPIVRGVDLTVQRGEVLGLIGESGAGKSTIGLAAMGYVRAGCRFAGGTVTFNGQDLLSLDRKAQSDLRGARIAYVAQSATAAFNPSHRLMPQVIEARLRQEKGCRSEAEADARALFGKLHLPDPDRIGLRYPHEVSGGQLQRAMTAMAMACRPDLIIFDEPTTALDVTTQVEVLAAIRAIVDEFHTAALYITHDLAVVAQLAHRILVLRHGQAVEEAPTRTMLHAPRENYTRTLWAVRNLRKAPRASNDVVLAMTGIHASYGKAKVLNNVSITVERGCTVAVVGESGSGKTTLARVVTGLLPPTQGEVLFFGERLSPKLKGRTPDQFRRIQMIYQSPDAALNPRHSVRDVIGRPLTLFRGLAAAASEARIRELLEMVQLGQHLLDRLPGALSGGQKQRLCIARALAAEPELVICDEVTSALDQIVQEEILKLLLRLQEELGMSYLFITHDLATVRAIADSIVVMKNGRVVQQGPRDVVLSPPHPAYTELLLSSVPTMDPDWLTALLASRAQTTTQTA